MYVKQITNVAAVLSLSLAALVATTSANAAYRVASVDANSTKVYTYTAEPGERFRVEISGDGDTDVDLYVRGPSGATVCRGISPTDDEACTVYSPYGGVYRIEVKNLGDIFNRVQFWLV